MPILVFQLDPDEGQNLATLMMYRQGYDLYGDILSDQPPLFTVILDYWLRFWEPFIGGEHQVLMARLFVLLCATVLVWTFAQIVRLTVGDRPAIVATLFLIFSCNFLRLSVSAMIGIPSLTFALLAVYCLTLVDVKKSDLSTWTIRVLAILSGVALAISLMIKMFTLFLIPLLGGFWLWSSLKINKRVALESILLFVFGLIGGFILIGLTYNSANELEKFWQFHTNTSFKEKFVNESSWWDIFVFYLQDLDYVIICLLGIFSLKKKLNSLPLFPLVWLGLITVLLLNHKPIWYHHYLLISIPLCWLAASGIRVLEEKIKENKGKKLAQIDWCSPANLSAVFLVLAFFIKGTVVTIENQKIIYQSNEANIILSEVLSYKEQTHWLFTDVPMYGVRAQINVIPELAMVSRKRLVSGQVTGASAIKIVESYQPEQFIFGRFPELEESLKPYLTENFKQNSYPDITHFIRKDIVNP
jgi:4-amino-4-deoxy-L-arabinose transferase-like glycosyltransferase